MHAETQHDGNVRCEGASGHPLNLALTLRGDLRLDPGLITLPGGLFKVWRGSHLPAVASNASNKPIGPLFHDDM